MASLTSASTNAEVMAAYDDNASYAEDGSTSKAAAFITAVRILLRRQGQAIAVDGQTVTFSPQTLRDELREARRWLAQRSSGGSNRFLDFSDQRD